MAAATPASRTTAVNVKREAFDVYIGRAMPARNLPQSPFANPFIIGRDGGREEVIAKYRAWLTTQPRLLQQLEGLRGRRLGCWCKPQACHGDVLVEILEGPPAAAPVSEQSSLF